MDIFVDDIGSFPLPLNINRKLFEKTYFLAKERIDNGRDVRKDSFLLNNFYQVILNSFKRKLDTGLDIVTYPQHFDIYRQFLTPIHKAMEKGTYIVDEKYATIPEIYVIKEEAKNIYDQTGKKVLLRACVTGPFELYFKEVGMSSHKDVLFMFAETVRRFAKNSVINSKYIKTEAVAIDEPSLGFFELPFSSDTIIKVLEKTFDFNTVKKQIHFHSLSRIKEFLEVKNLEVLSIEYAATPKNLEKLSVKMLDKADKKVRIGISRTDIDSTMAEFYEKNLKKQPSIEELIESEERIKQRFRIAKEKFKDKMVLTGPDCGLGGWPTQKAAELLLRRTVKAVKEARKIY
jgi:5-methyltetrahydropteroyltriglutamate--homocysteine methyltransferase